MSMHICPHCGQEYDEHDMTLTAHGDWVCPDCLDEHYFQCDSCGGWHRKYDLISVNDGELDYCPDCATSHAYQCDDCGCWFTRRRMTYRQDAGYSHNICDDCEDCWHRCAQCGDLVHENDALEEDCRYFCSDSCLDDHRMSYSIASYGYKPDPVFGRRRGESESALTFGVELEVDCGDDASQAAYEVRKFTDRVYCKHDGSLEEGFEIVTHPGTLAHHMYEMRWKGISQICRRHGFKSHDTDTCGLHIHVGRSGLGQNDHERYETAAKLVLLAVRLWEDLTVFSRRKSSQLDDWARCPSVDLDCDPADLIALAYDTERNGRYQAVNLTNSSTVEFRIFRGSLERDTIIASLQLVSNLCQYAMTHTASECVQADWDEVVDFVSYKELDDYCTRKNLVHGQIPA